MNDYQNFNYREDENFAKKQKKERQRDSRAERFPRYDCAIGAAVQF
jgi:hypothetical protein